MATTIESVQKDIQERAAQLREQLHERERRYREETQALRDELSRLDAALSAIGGEPAVAERRPASPAARAPRGQNKAKILAVVSERPGVSPSEVASSTGIQRNVVYTTLSKLAASGEVEKIDVNGAIGYRVGSEQSAEG